MKKYVRKIDTKIVKKYLLINLPYAVIFIIALWVIPQIPFKLPVHDAAVALRAAVAIRLMVYVRGKNAKKYRNDIEYGSARWGKPQDIKPYVDPNPDNNVILTATESLTMNSRPSSPKYARNKNVLVIGGSGSGKTRFFVKPNLMQMHSSYIITDPKGTLVLECGKMLKDNGYRIRYQILKN